MFAPETRAFCFCEFPYLTTSNAGVFHQRIRSGRQQQPSASRVPRWKLLPAALQEHPGPPGVPSGLYHASMRGSPTSHLQYHRDYCSTGSESNDRGALGGWAGPETPPVAGRLTNNHKSSAPLAPTEHFFSCNMFSVMGGGPKSWKSFPFPPITGSAYSFLRAAVCTAGCRQLVAPLNAAAGAQRQRSTSPGRFPLVAFFFLFPMVMRVTSICIWPGWGQPCAAGNAVQNRRQCPYERVEFLQSS